MFMRPTPLGPTVTVQGQLDGAEQIRNPLHSLWSHGAGKTFRKTVRTLGGGNAVLASFKTDKTAPRSQMLNKNGFHALPQTQKANNGRIL